jgi:signal transduction histidine kinase
VPASNLTTDEPELLGLLLAQLPAGLVVVDASGRLWLLNAAAALQWGLEPSAPLPPAEALTWSTPEGTPLPASDTPLARALRGEHLQAERSLLRRRDGSTLAVRCDARPLLGAEGVRGAMLLTQPVMESPGAAPPKDAPAPVDAERGRDEFLAMVSHELRTPLNAVLGWASVLRGRKVTPSMMEKALESIERNARIQARLVEDLLDLGRVVSGKLRVGLRPLEPRGFIQASLETVRSAAEAKGVVLEAALEGADGLTVSGDPERLQQVVWNLLSNAVKFTPAGGRVLVRALAEGGQLVVEVRDTGMGIPADFMPHLFVRFRQADAGQVKAQRGLGLGLALVRHLVELHGGTVSAHSEGEGRGSTFRVCLPLVPSAG